MYLGDIQEDESVTFWWSSNDSNGASQNPSGYGSYKVDRDDGTDCTGSSVSSSNADPDVGIHRVTIDTSDSANFATGHDYTVWIDGATIDSQTVNAALATFSIENRLHDIAEAGGYSAGITVRTTGSSAIQGARVWLSSSATGSPVTQGYLTTDAAGLVTFWVPNGTYYIFAAGAGYDYTNDESITINNANNTKTVDYGTLVGTGGSDAGTETTDSTISKLLARIRLLVDEPTANKKYSDSHLLRLSEEAFAQILQELNRNESTQLVADYSFSYVDGTDRYILPPTVGTVISIGEVTTEGYKDFFGTGSRNSTLGIGCKIEGNTINFQPDFLSGDETVHVYYLPDGAAHLFSAFATTVDNDVPSVTAPASPTEGTIDARPNAYLGYILRVLPTSPNSIEQQRIITAQSGSTYKTYTVSPAWSTNILATGSGAKFEVLPSWYPHLWTVAALKVALRIAGIEGNTRRHQTLMLEYRDARRSLDVSAFNRDFMHGPTRSRDAYHSRRRGWPYGRCIY